MSHVNQHLTIYYTCLRGERQQSRSFKSQELDLRTEVNPMCHHEGIASP